MGINIHARWRGMTAEERSQYLNATDIVASAKFGYLFEGYHGGPYATMCLVREAFGSPRGECPIPAEVLRQRLTEVLKLADECARTKYGSDSKVIASLLQSYREFVTLCERKERETGEPVTIIVSY